VGKQGEEYVIAGLEKKVNMIPYHKFSKIGESNPGHKSSFDEHAVCCSTCLRLQHKIHDIP
jgi:hypothetical protein